MPALASFSVAVSRLVCCWTNSISLSVSLSVGMVGVSVQGTVRGEGEREMSGVMKADEGRLLLSLIVL